MSARLRFLRADDADPAYIRALDLRFRVLRAPLGMPRGSERSAADDEAWHLIAEADDGRVLGVVLLREQPAERDATGRVGRLFQMAVDPALQGMGLGAALVRRLEARAIELGYAAIVLHARETAVGFYSRLGYDTVGAPYTEVGIPHVDMTRRLPSAATAHPQPESPS